MLSQQLINGLISSAAICLVALGFALVYRVTGLFHIAHGALYVAGMYVTYACISIAGLALGFAIMVGVGITIALGLVFEIGVSRPLRRKKSSILVIFVASLGFYVVLQNVISLLFGNGTRSIRTWSIREGWEILGAHITPVQVIIIASAITLSIAVMIFQRWTKMGQGMRAVASDPELASISGLNVNNIILLTFVLGSALAGIAGIVVSLDADMTPTMGMRALLMGVVAVIVGGRNSIPGVALGALILGMTQHLGTWQISAKWQDAIVFVILLIFLLFRPQGFFGKKMRTVHV